MSNSLEEMSAEMGLKTRGVKLTTGDTNMNRQFLDDSEMRIQNRSTNRKPDNGESGDTNINIDNTKMRIRNVATKRTSDTGDTNINVDNTEMRIQDGNIKRPPDTGDTNMSIDNTEMRVKNVTTKRTTDTGDTDINIDDTEMRIRIGNTKRTPGTCDTNISNVDTEMRIENGTIKRTTDTGDTNMSNDNTEMRIKNGTTKRTPGTGDTNMSINNTEMKIQNGTTKRKTDTGDTNMHIGDTEMRIRTGVTKITTDTGDTNMNMDDTEMRKIFDISDKNMNIVVTEVSKDKDATKLKSKIDQASLSSYGTIDPPEKNLCTSGNKGGTSEKEVFSFRRSTTANKLTLISIALVNFCASATYSLLAPFYPSEASKKGLTQTQIGMIFGLYGLLIFLTAPVLGGMITKIGAKVMFLCGIFLSGTCQILFGALEMLPNGTVFFVLCFLTRSLEALGGSAVVVAGFAIIAHDFPGKVSMVFGTLEIFTGFGFMVGPPLGGFLFEVGGYGLPFYALGGLLILCGITCCLILPTLDDHDTVFNGSTLSLFLKPSAFVVTVSVVVVAAALGFFDAALTNHLNMFGLSPLWTGWLFFLLPFVYAISAPIWGWIADTKGYILTMLITGNFLCAVPLILIGPIPCLNLSPQLWLVVTSLIMAGLFMGLTYVPSVKALIDIAKANGYPENFQTHGIVSGLFNSAVYFGEFLGPITMGGIVVDSIGFQWSAGICAVSFIAMGITIAAHQAISRFLSDGFRSNSFKRLKMDR